MASEGMDEESLIAVACVHLEMKNAHGGDYGEPPEEPQENDLLYAQEFLDHLDTLGKMILSK